MKLRSLIVALIAAASLTAVSAQDYPVRPVSRFEDPNDYFNQALRLRDKVGEALKRGQYHTATGADDESCAALLRDPSINHLVQRNEGLLARSLEQLTSVSPLNYPARRSIYTLLFFSYQELENALEPCWK